MRDVFELVAECRRATGEATAIEYNATHQTKVFRKGEWVLLLENSIVPGFNKNLLAKTQHDVYLIEEVLSEQTYLIKNLKTGFSGLRVQGGQLRPYHHRKKHPTPSQTHTTTPTEGTREDKEDNSGDGVDFEGSRGVDTEMVSTETTVWPEPTSAGVDDILGDKEEDLFGTGAGRRSTTQQIVSHRLEDGDTRYRIAIREYRKPMVYRSVTRAALQGTQLLEDYEAAQRVKRVQFAPGVEPIPEARPSREARPVFKEGFVYSS